MEHSRLERLFLPLFLAFFALFFIQKIDLSTADLGRMLKNGEAFFSEKKALAVNRYSYTEPDTRIPNSHTAADAAFYAVKRLGGFEALTFFYAALMTAALWFFMAYAARASGWGASILFAALALPLTASRVLPRPEAFSYLFLGIFLDRLSQKKTLWLLPLVQLVWVNTHFWFFLGPLLVALFALHDRRLWKIFAATLAASLINPFFVEGALAPLLLFRHYGYIPGEVYPLIDVMRHMPHAVYAHFVILAAAAALMTAFAVKQGRFKEHFPVYAMAFLFAFATFKAVRAYPLFGFFFIAAAAAAAGPRKFPAARRTGLLLTLLYLAPFSFLSPAANFGAGLVPGNSASADFFKVHALKGPIFNNFGIGGYLEYHLYPAERVFVDNRPEAFSGEFFENTYMPALADEGAWRALDAKYRFEAIWFHLKMHAYLKPARGFLIRRLHDPQWALVYSDAWTALLVRRDGANRAAAETYGIAPERIVIA